MRNKEWRMLMVFLFCGLLAIPAYAQQSTATDDAAKEQLSEDEKKKLEDSAQTTETSTGQQKEPIKAKGNEGASKRVFKPSEEISEDSPVPFPVDI